MSGGPQQLLVHLGMQKTGTSYLQAAMLAGRDGLAAAGVDLVPPSKRDCFELMVVLRDRYEARREESADRRTLDRFGEQLRRAGGMRAVYSQESLAGMGPRQIARFLELAGGREVHVVVTVRDLARQLSSSWQQELKAGSSVDLSTYLRRLRRQQEAGAGGHPWIHLDPPRVLARWAEVLPAERIHVVTVPPSGSPAIALLGRFADVLGVDPVLLVPEDRPSNSSLGLAQAEVLRRVNAGLPPQAHRRYVYADIVKRGLSADVLVHQPARRILVPPRFRAWAEQVAAEQVAALAAASHDVVGSLDDLACPDAAFAGVPQVLGEEEVAASSVDALTTLLARRGTALAERRDGRIGVRDDDGLVARVRRRLGR